MVARYIAKVGPRGPHSGTFKKKHDRRRNNGRKKGIQNRIPRLVKDAIAEAMERFGLDGKGKEGMVGYFMRLLQDDALGCRLAEKLIPVQVTGPNDGPVQIFSIPQDMIREMSTPELQALDTAFRRLASIENAGRPGLVIEGTVQDVPGDAQRYMKSLNGGTKH